MQRNDEHTLANELVNKLRYFEPKGDECSLCGICKRRYNCDYDDLRGCKLGIAEWIATILRTSNPLTNTEEKSYYERNKERIKATNKKWQEKNKEKFRALCKRYYELHREEIAAQKKKKGRRWYVEKMAWRIEKDKNSSKALQNLCREQLVCKILADIATDISVCRLEGWDWRELPKRIIKEMQGLLRH